MDHYDQKPIRRAEFITPPNTLKAKVGSGGIDEIVLQKAQALLENNSTDFIPLANTYLIALMNGIERCKNAQSGEDPEYLMSTLIYPALQLKANGGMFGYPLVTRIADKLVQFLEVTPETTLEVIEITLAFHTSITAVIQGKIEGDGGQHGDELVQALTDACMRYFAKHDDDR